MKCDEIREKFLKFFEARGHKIVPGDSIVPANDPSVLFTSAGMNQFKEQFMGHNVSFRRAATCQKCLRTADLENVGRTASHHTFFEMLGNFSFGDYFKKEAIRWAWGFMTEELNLSPADLQVSVYEEDLESYNIWVNDIKVPVSKILKFGDKENFWPSEVRKNGPNGPCGPCSEIFYIPTKGELIEVWNLVFTQFNRKDGGVLEDLPSKNIDTGMGLERLAQVCQGVATNFEIDAFLPIIEAICSILTLKKGVDKSRDSHINAIADHIRAVTFAIGDGVYPSNEDRGFVVRKLIRRSIQRAAQLKPIREPFLYKIVPSVGRVMKNPYPELEKQRETISQIIKGEEERFQAILSDVVPVIREEFEIIKNSGAKKIPGEVIFKYSDERGVPFDFQKEIAQEMGLVVDEKGFNDFLKGQRERSKAKSKISKEIFTAPAGLARKADEEWDEASKEKIRINHTATHLLHSALRKALGEHARQSGSLVYPDRLRFDFTHPKKLEKDEILKVEELVNQQIQMGCEVRREVMKVEEAKRQGAIALFGEKYADEAVVRTIGDFSKELCGGDHIDNTKKLLVFKIIQESSISAGTRRIEAVTGDEAYAWLGKQVEKTKIKLNDFINKAGKLPSADLARTKISEAQNWFDGKNKETLAYSDIKRWFDYEAAFAKLMETLDAEKKNMERGALSRQKEALSNLATEIMSAAKDIKGIKAMARVLPDMGINSLRGICDIIVAQAPVSAVLLASASEGKANLVLAVAKEALKKGLSAKELIAPISACVGGSGGGRPEFAQAGGRDVSKINEVVVLFYKLIEERA